MAKVRRREAGEGKVIQLSNGGRWLFSPLYKDYRRSGDRATDQGDSALISSRFTRIVLAEARIGHNRVQIFKIFAQDVYNHILYHYNKTVIFLLGGFRNLAQRG